MSRPKDAQEAELIIKFQNGDASALEQLDKKYRAKTIQLIAKMVRNIEDAEDIYQEAILKAAAHIDKFQSSGDFYAWLHKIALNQCRDHLRKVKREPKVVCIEEAKKALAGGQNPLSAAENRELRAQIEEAVASLPSRQRQIARLRLFHGLRYSQIADIIGGNPNTIKALFSKARTTLRNRLKSYISAVVLPFRFLKKLSNIPIFSSLSSFTVSILLHILAIIFLFHLPLSTDRYKINDNIEVFLASEGDLSFGRASARREIQFSAPLFKKRKEIESVPAISKEAERNLFAKPSFQVGLSNRSTSPSSISLQNRARFAPNAPAGESRENPVFPNPTDIPDKEFINTPKLPNSVITRKDKINTKRRIFLSLIRKIGHGIFAIDGQKTPNADKLAAPDDKVDLVFVFARSDLTLGFTPLLKKYLSEYVAKIEAGGYSIACGMVVYSPANLYGAGIYDISSDKGRLSFLLSELDKIRGDVASERYLRKEQRGDRRTLDGISVALKKISFPSRRNPNPDNRDIGREAQRRLLFVTRNKVGDVLDLHRGILRYCPISSLDYVIEKSRDLRIRVDVVGLDEQRARRLAKETGGSFSDVRLLEAGELKP
ncbi:MAG: RNA polymerase sigma factor [Candidatus Poribacteria bacterium]